MPHPRLTFHGAAGAVTGSCFRLETDRGQILIDCGMFQGSKTEKELNYRPFPLRARQDRRGDPEPCAYRPFGPSAETGPPGISGTIHATPATIDLAGVMLPDSAHIQEIEVEQFNRRAAHHNRDRVEPIYDGADVGACLALFRPQT